MEIKIKEVYKYLVFFTLVFFYAPSSMLAQTVTALTLGPSGSPITQFCAHSGTVTYTATFTISGPAFGAGNVFKLQISDINGSFVTPVQLSNVATVSGSTGTFSNINIPFGTAGQNYKYRVVTTNPATTSSSVGPVPAYYQPFYEGFFINNKVNTVDICGSGSFTLAIDNPTPSEHSPLSTPNLTYIWKKNGIVIASQTGPTLSVNAAGTYFVAIDYGACTSSSIAYSQSVVVTVVPGGSTFTVTSSGGTTICPSTPTTLSTTPGYSYQWFHDGISIAGANSFNYVATQPGAYHVSVNQGGCNSSSNTVTLTTTDFNASIDVLELPQVNIIAVGETKTVTATTDAASPTFEWYLNGALLPETTNVLTTSTAGDYKLVIHQTSGCILSKTLFFKFKEGVNAVKIPNIVSPNGDGTNDTWVIPQEYIADNTEITIISETGKIALKTNDYQNNWPESALEFKSVNPVYYYIIKKDGKEVKKGSITIIK